MIHFAIKIRNEISRAAGVTVEEVEDFSRKDALYKAKAKAGLSKKEYKRQKK